MANIIELEAERHFFLHNATKQKKRNVCSFTAHIVQQPGFGIFQTTTTRGRWRERIWERDGGSENFQSHITHTHGHAVIQKQGRKRAIEEKKKDASALEKYLSRGRTKVLKS